MAFKLLDFGIPNYESNVKVLYQQAIENGKSYFIDDKEFVVYQAGHTKLLLVLCFDFAEDGETPINVVAHTFLDNEVRWHGTLQVTENGVFFDDGKQLLPVEVVHTPKDTIHTWLPMLYVDAIDFKKNESVFIPFESAFVVEDKAVQVVARLGKITPVVLSQLWVYSIVELFVGDRQLYCPVPRELIEEQMASFQEGTWCRIKGQLSLMKDWAMS